MALPSMYQAGSMAPYRVGQMYAEMPSSFQAVSAGMDQGYQRAVQFAESIGSGVRKLLETARSMRQGPAAVNATSPGGYG